MALTIYGSPRSRTMRVLWMAAELGLDYSHVPLAFDNPELKSSAFLALNPAGAVPMIVDGEVVLSESMAINLYLAKRYGSPALYPSEAAAEAQLWRWSLWAQGHLEPFVQKDALLAGMRTAMAGPGARAIGAALTTLERALGGRDWLAAGRFTAADLNVAGVLSPSRSRELNLSAFPSVAAWLARCYGRPAAVETRCRFAA